nr:hypothetical protein [Endozoicomonas sp.]
MVSDNEGVDSLLPKGGGVGYRRVTQSGQAGNGVTVRSESEPLDFKEARCHSRDKSLEKISCSDMPRHESDRGYEQIRKYSLVMGFVNELKDKENSEDNESVAIQDHRLVKKLKDYFESTKFNEGGVYKVGFTVDDFGEKINLEFARTLPVTLATPQPEGKNVFASAFSDEKKLSPISSPDGICIEIDELNNEELFAAIIDNIQSLKQAGGDSELKLFIRFRRQLPSDQEILTYPGYRFVTGTGDPAKAYVSDTLRISSKEEKSLYIEFQIPLIELFSADLDKIIDKSREYPSTIKTFHKNNDFTESINNRNNWEIIHSKTTTIVRNMEQAAPEKNAFTDDYLGSGIAQKVSVNGAYPSMALKFLPLRMKSEVEATIVINTLRVMQAMTEMIMESAVSGKNNTPKICFSPVDYLTIVDQEVLEDEEDDQSSDELNDNPDKSGSHFLQLPRLTGRSHSNSESEQLHEMINVPVKAVLTLEDELKRLVDSGMSPDEGVQCQEVERADQSVHQLNKKRKVIWVAGMQRRYDKKQMVEYILQDPNEDAAIKIEIVKGIINAIDVFDNFNKEIEVKGGSQLKCIIDANFGNFAFDRVGHRLIYLDVAPATCSLDGQVVPGNQFMVNWFTSREKFVHKLSTDVQMSKLFLLVLVTNQLRKLEVQSRLYEDEGVRDENLNRRVTGLDHVVSMISNQLAENEKFMSWCDSTLLDFLTATVKVDMFDGDARNDFFSRASNSFQGYMNNEPRCNSSELLTKDLSIAEHIKLLRLVADVAADYLAGVKKDAMDLSPNRVKKIGLLSKGVVNKKMLGDLEVRNLVKIMANHKVEHFLSGSVSKSDVFYDVVLKWLNHYDFGKDCGFPLGSVREFKESVTGNGLGVTDGDDLQDKKKIVSLPSFLNSMDKFMSKKIDVLLIEPFSGDGGKVRTVQYKWDVASDGSHEIVLNEYSGAGALQNLMGVVKPKTLILVNHQVNNLYSMGDVGDFHWSSVSLGESKSEQSLKFNSVLPLEYEQEKTDVFDKAVFEQIVLALKKLYQCRNAMAESEQGELTFSDEEFLRRIIPWIPESCIEWRAEGGEKESALIKMNLSSSNMFRFKPLLRGYSDMIRSELGKQDCSRIYMVMYFPEAGKYVRWMLRVSTRVDQELSYMNFRGPFSLAELKNDIQRSTQGASSELDFMFIDGGYGYSSGNFYLHKVPATTVQSGFSHAFFREIEKAHPEGSADQETGSTDFYDCNDIRDDTDNLTSLELQQRIFKLDS